MPGVSVCCFTDDPAYAAQFFSHVEIIHDPFRNFLEKIPPLWKSPFERTLFLDTDTIITAPIDDLFDLLDRFDLAAAPDPFWVQAPGCPPCFQHLNTGVIAYRRTDKVMDFFRNWFGEYKTELAAASGHLPHDQVSFQRLLYASDLRLYLLPPEYNLRLTCPQLVRIWAKARIIHSRDMPDLPDLGRRLNSESNFRVVFPNWTLLRRTSLHILSRRSDRVLSFLIGVFQAGVTIATFALRQSRRIQRLNGKPLGHHEKIVQH
jgi:hypothetical protein